MSAGRKAFRLLTSPRYRRRQVRRMVMRAGQVAALGGLAGAAWLWSVVGTVWFCVISVAAVGGVVARKISRRDRTALYRYYSKAGYEKNGIIYPPERLGYGGITGLPPVRHLQHLKDPVRPHAREGGKPVIEWFKSRAAAKAAETKMLACFACGGEDPLFNIQETCWHDGHRHGTVRRLIA